MRCVRGHFQHIRQILRNTKMRREISLTKTCVSFAVTYLVLWGGFAICVCYKEPADISRSTLRISVVLHTRLS